MTVQRPKPNKKSTVESTELTPALPSKPSSVAELPGLGPIRLRALQKAGFDTLVKLKAATQSELEQVPGITPTKAEQIRTMIAPFRFEKEDSSTQRKAPFLKTEKTEPAPSKPKSESEYPFPEVLIITQSTARLLFRHDISEMRGRLQYQLERLIQLPSVWKTIWPHLDSKVQDEWPEYILKLAKQMDKLKKDRKLTRQQQGDLADAIMLLTFDPKGIESRDEDE